MSSRFRAAVLRRTYFILFINRKFPGTSKTGARPSGVCHEKSLLCSGQSLQVIAQHCSSTTFTAGIGALTLFLGMRPNSGSLTGSSYWLVFQVVCGLFAGLVRLVILG